MRYTRKATIEHGDAVWKALESKKNKDVAWYMDVQPVIVSHWKRGSLAIEWETFVRLCEYLGVNHEQR